MDPASATVAFVGFAASLATLVGLVLESAQTINNFCGKFERAPKELQRFQSTVKQLNCLLAMLKEQTSQYADEDLPPNLLEYWLENVVQMRTDYEALKTIGLKLQGQFDIFSVSKKHVRARIRHFFCSEEISELETRLSAHVAKLHLALTMIAQIRSEHMDSTLAAISQQTVITHSTIQDGFQEAQSVSRRREEYLVRVAEEMSGIRKDLRSALDRVTKPDPSGRQRGPWRVEMEGGNLPSELLWILRETSTKSIVRSYWFGLLHITCTSKTTSMTRLQEDIIFNSSTGPISLQIIFVPPWWVSDTLIAVAIDSSMRFSVNRGQVNIHPRILKVLRSCDVDGLKDLFGRGLARPTDLVVDPHGGRNSAPMPLLQVVNRMSNRDIDGEYPSQRSWPDFFRFVLQETGAISAAMNDELCSRLMENSVYKKSAICDLLIDHGVDLSGILNSVAWSENRIISNLVAMYAQGPRSFIHEFAIRHIGLQEYWEMTNVNSWILRAIARSEPRFSSKLRAQEEALRFSKNHGISKAGWLGLDLSIETQSIEMRHAKSSERQLYLLAMCAGGTATDLDALIAHPEDVPELVSLSRPETYLYVSATYGNQETFYRLLDAIVGYPILGKEICEALSGRETIPSQFNDPPSSYKVRAKMMERFLTKSGVPADIMTHLWSILVTPRGSGKTRSSYFLSSVNLNPEIPKPAPNNTRTEIARNDWLVAAAAAWNNIDALEQLINSDFDLEWQDKDGFTPLMIAILGGAKQATQMLIEAGADVHERKSCGFSVSELVRALRTEIENRGFLVRGNMPKLLGTKLRYPSPDHLDWYGSPRKGRIDWFDSTAREELLEILALVPHVDLELKNDGEETLLDLDTTPTDGRYQYTQGLRLLGSKPNHQSSPFSRLYSQFFKFDSALIIIGYIIGITVHICYDFCDSLSWIFRLPRPAIRTLVVIGLVLLYRWFWKVSTDYFTAILRVKVNSIDTLDRNA